MAEYLLAEVLDRQSDEVRSLLLRTSVLERVNGELALGSLRAAERYLKVAARELPSVPSSRRGQAEVLLGVVQLLSSGRKGDQRTRAEQAQRLLAAAEAPPMPRAPGYTVADGEELRGSGPGRLSAGGMAVMARGCVLAGGDRPGHTRRAGRCRPGRGAVSTR